MIPFDATKYDGYIFDCDGTLADTMPLHYRAWSETLALKLGRPSDFTESLFYHFGGMPPRQIIQRLNQEFGYGLEVEKTAHEKEMRFLEMLPGIQPVPEVVEVLHRLGPSAKVAVASGGLTEIVRETLHLLGLEAGPDQIIKVIIGSDQVTHGGQVSRSEAGAVPGLRGRRARFPGGKGGGDGLHRRAPLSRCRTERGSEVLRTVRSRARESVAETTASRRRLQRATQTSHIFFTIFFTGPDIPFSVPRRLRA